MTTGTISLDSSVQQKQLAWSDLQGFKRVIVYGLNQLTFDGRFAEVTADVSEIRNAVGASPSGAPVAVSVTRLSKPKSVRVERQ